MVQQLEGKLAVAGAESKEAAKAMKQLQEDFEASQSHRSALHCPARANLPLQALSVPFKVTRRPACEKFRTCPAGTILRQSLRKV